MARLYSAMTLVMLTLLREWKATAALLIALYIAIALVGFLDRSMIYQCVSRRPC
jgi:hypothetical protein